MKKLVLESLFNKAAGPKACNFIKKRLQHRCFPVKFSKILRIPILNFGLVGHLTHARTRGVFRILPDI